MKKAQDLGRGMADRPRRAGRLVGVAVVVAAAFLCSIAAAAPQRVVSMNVCTDQLAMLIAAPGQLASVSYLAVRPDVAVLHAEAKTAGYALNYGLAEQIFLMAPDLVLAGAYSARASTAMLERLGFRVEIFQPARSFEDIRVNIARVGVLLGREARADALIAELDAKLDGLVAADETAPSVAAFFANGYSVGDGALLHDAMRRGGWRNAGVDYGISGVGKLPLELVVSRPPDALLANPENRRGPALAHEVLTHPALRRTRAARPTIRLAEAITVCGAPFTADAARTFAAARAALIGAAAE